MAKGRGLGVENYGDVIRLIFLEDFQERLGKAEHCAGVDPFGINQRVADESKIGAVGQSRPVYQEKSFGSRHSAKINLAFRSVNRIKLRTVLGSRAPLEYIVYQKDYIT